MLESSEKRRLSSTGNCHSSAKKARREAREGPRSRVNELDEEWEGLLKKENNSLLNRLVQENRELHHTFQQFQAKLESIVLGSKECLESTQHVKIDSKMCGSQSIQSKEQNGKQGHDAGVNEPATNSAAKSPSISEEASLRVSLSTSIIFRAAVIAGRSLESDQGINPNELCESIMAWKVRSGQSWDFSFLLSHFQWHDLSSFLKRGASTFNIMMGNLGKEAEIFVILADTTIRLLTASNFYPRLLESLFGGTELDGLNSKDYQPLDKNWNFTGMMQQRRSVAFCAYILVNQYRPYAASQLVTLVQFWLLLNFLIFLTLPTEENLKKIPHWLWPTKRQLCHDHPGVIDFVIWPGIRSALVQDWRSYKLPELFADLTRHLEFRDAQVWPDSAVIKASSDGTRLEIDSAFQKSISDLRNYRIGPQFCQKYPNLAQCFESCEEFVNATPPSDSCKV
ncbi:hypothetical protein N7490_008270 [Penicillium lividum]|nr:hypothetical protein N7490_008270 [Penicillium lividum]